MNIYVTNLPYTTTENELHTLFYAYGTVDSVWITRDRYTGQSQGFGFVEMPDATQAHEAIEALNGMSLGGRTLTVNKSRPREDQDNPRHPRG